jgi:hypothetical protein
VSRARLTSAACVVGLVALALALSWAHIARYDQISPIDESMHLDSLVQGAHGKLVSTGDFVRQDVLGIVTCHRLDSDYDVKIPPCDPSPSGELDVGAFPEGGYNHTAIHQPLYYVVDGVLARGISRVLPGDQDWLVAGRLAGGLWIVAGVVAMWALFREVRADRLVASALVATLVAAPTALHAASTVNPDGTGLFAGAFLVWAVLRWERGRLSVWIPVVGAVLAGATKVTNVFVVGLVLLYLLVRVVQSRQPSDGPWSGQAVRQLYERNRRLLLGALGLVGGFALVSLAWTVISRSIEEIPNTELPIVSRFVVDSFPVQGFVDSWRATVSPLSDPYLAPVLRTDPVRLVAGLTALALVAVAVTGTIRAAAASRERALGVASLSSAVLAGPVLVLLNLVLLDMYVGAPVRYVISIVPALAAAGVPVVSGRWGRVGVAAVAVAGVLSVGVPLVTG